METTENFKGDFGILYHPKSALIFYQSADSNPDCYVESFDMDENGNLINAHPLTVREAGQLAKSLRIESSDKKPFLRPDGLIGSHILYIDPSPNGSVVWQSKAQRRELFFAESLGIPNGHANTPSLLWKADRNRLSVFALTSNRRATEKTPLYHAPFFNTGSEGSVCMGTVDINIKKTSSLKAFTTAWENYFFNSYFSHLMVSHNPIRENPISFWKNLMDTEKPFPTEVLIKNSRTVKNLLP